jgi:hypothetical protein
LEGQKAVFEYFAVGTEFFRPGKNILGVKVGIFAAVKK